MEAKWNQLIAIDDLTRCQREPGCVRAAPRLMCRLTGSGRPNCTELLITQPSVKNSWRRFKSRRHSRVKRRLMSC